MKDPKWEDGQGFHLLTFATPRSGLTWGRAERYWDPRTTKTTDAQGQRQCSAQTGLVARRWWPSCPFTEINAERAKLVVGAQVEQQSRQPTLKLPSRQVPIGAHENRSQYTLQVAWPPGRDRRLT